MAHTLLRRFACVCILTVCTCASAQDVGSRVPEEAVDSGASQPAAPGRGDQPEGTGPEESPTDHTTLSFYDRFLAMFSLAEDKDGPINTDRPTFTPANTVVPPKRLQIESGFTYNRVHSNSTTDSVYDFPELAFRYGLVDRVEFRMFWLGPTFDEAPSRVVHGAADWEVPATWRSDLSGNYSPVTKTGNGSRPPALITSVIAPTGELAALFGNGRALYQFDLWLEPDREADPGR